MTSPHEHLRALWARIEDFTRRVEAHDPGALTCAPGCDDCCQRRFSVTALEADALRALLAGMDAPRRAQLRARAARDDGRCPALDDDGRCAVYDARPVICRTHGLALRFPPEPGRRALPVVDACPKNYRGRDLTALDPRTVLDQGTLSTVLAALDAARADALRVPRGAREALADVLA